MFNNSNSPKSTQTARPRPSTDLLAKTPSHQISAHSTTKSLSDKDLYAKCQEYGGNAKKWLQKFAGLLPEVYRRFLYKKHGCGSIHEFAQKLSGMHERTTDKILNLHKRLGDKPHLLALFESGEQGWSKLEKVAFIATAETEADFAEKVKLLPQKALELFVQNHRAKLTLKSQAQNDLGITQVPASDQLLLLQGAETSSSIGLTATNSNSNSASNPDPDSAGIALVSPAASPYSEIFTSFSFPISIRSRQKLNIVKLTLEKQHKQTLTWNQVITLWPIHNQKIIIKKVCPSCALKLAGIQPQNPSSLNPAPHKSPPPAGSPASSRPIPTTIKNLILATHGQICTFPNCNQAPTEFHHIKPFAIYKSHDPAHIFPICSAHHTLFHAGLIENSNKSPQHWSIRSHARQTTIDKKAMEFKMKT